MFGGSRFIVYCSGLSISPLIPTIRHNRLFQSVSGITASLLTFKLLCYSPLGSNDLPPSQAALEIINKLLDYTDHIQIIFRLLSLKRLLQRHGCSSPLITYQPSTTKYNRKWTSSFIYPSIPLQIPSISVLNDEEEPLSRPAQDYESQFRKIQKIRKIR